MQLEEAAKRMGLEQERETGADQPHDDPAVGADGDTTEPEPPTPKRRLSAYLWAMLIARVVGALSLISGVRERAKSEECGDRPRRGAAHPRAPQRAHRAPEDRARARPAAGGLP